MLARLKVASLVRSLEMPSGRHQGRSGGETNDPTLPLPNRASSISKGYCPFCSRGFGYRVAGAQRTKSVAH